MKLFTKLIVYKQKYGLSKLLKKLAIKFIRAIFGRLIIFIAIFLHRIRLPNIILNGSVAINQLWSGRSEVILKLIKTFEKKITVLEIGTWFGEGSTKIFLKNLKPNSKLILLDIWEPYVSKDDLANSQASTALMNQVGSLALSNLLRNISKYPSIDTTVIKSGNNSLSLLKENTFDFIYIDGSHYYETVKNDIDIAKKLINKKFGIICGDDLEIHPNKYLVNLSKKFKNIDFIEHDNSAFHPGVMLAVYEEFGEVNCDNGIWWIYIKNNKFTKTI